MLLLRALNAPRQNVHFSLARAVVVVYGTHQKAKQKCGLVVIDRICHSTAGRLIMAVVVYSGGLNYWETKGHLSARE